MSQFNESISIGERIEFCRHVVTSWIIGKFKLICESFVAIASSVLFMFAMLVELARQICWLPFRIPQFASHVRWNLQHKWERLDQLKKEIVEGVSHLYKWCTQINERRMLRSELAREVKPAIQKIRVEVDPGLLRQSISVVSDAERLRSVFGFFHLKLALSFAMTCVAGWLIYSVASSTESPSVSTRESKSNVLTIDQRLDTIASPPDSANTQFFGIAVESSPLDLASARLESLDSISAASDLSPDQQARIQQLRIQNLGELIRGYSKSGIDCDAFKGELLSLCQANVMSENLDLRNDSRFWIIAVSAIEFCSNPSDISLQKLINQYDEYPNVCLENFSHADMIYGLLKVANKSHGHLESTTKAILYFQQKISVSNNIAIQRKSEELLELSVFGKYNLDTLAKRVSWGGPAARDDLDSVIDELSKHPESGENTWLEIIRSCESLLSVSDHESFNSVISRVENLIADLPESGLKRLLISRLERQQIRQRMVGHNFDVDGYSVPNSDPLPSMDGNYKVVLLGQRDQRSEDKINLLVSLSSDSTYQSIVAFPEPNVVDTQIASSLPEAMFLANSETSNKYFDAIPIDFYPYVLLIDKSNKIVAVNINPNEIDSCISRYEKKSSEANE